MRELKLKDVVYNLSSEGYFVGTIVFIDYKAKPLTKYTVQKNLKTEKTFFAHELTLVEENEIC